MMDLHTGLWALLLTVFVTKAECATWKKKLCEKKVFPMRDLQNYMQVLFSFLVACCVFCCIFFGEIKQIMHLITEMNVFLTSKTTVLRKLFLFCHCRHSKTAAVL